MLALVHRHLVPPSKIEEGTDILAAPWRTEYNVISSLTAMGHEVQTLGVHDDLGDIRRIDAASRTTRPPPSQSGRPPAQTNNRNPTRSVGWPTRRRSAT